MSEFDTPNYAEYSYSVKSEGKIRLFRIAAILGYVAFVALFFTLCILTKLIPLFAVAPILTWMLVYFTWRYVSYDCYFVFESGRLELGRARNTKSGIKKFPKLKILVKDALYVGAYDKSERQTEGTELFDFSESQSSDKRIVIVFENNGEKCSAVFEGTKKIAKLLDLFCPRSQGIKNLYFHG